MEKLKITARSRDAQKTKTNKLKAGGEIHAVLYGHKVKNQVLAVKIVDFEKAFKAAGESTIIDLITDSGKTHPVIIQDVQIDNISSRPIHVDFYEVNMTEKLKAKVQIEFTG